MSDFISINGFEDYQEERILDKADYTVRVDKAEMVATSSGGMMVKLEETVIGGPEQEDGSDPQGRKIFDNLVLPNSGQKDGGRFAAVKLRKTLDAFGVQYDNTGFAVGDLVGQTAIARVNHRTYEDELQVDVKKYLPESDSSY
jgi:hypothetical protein